MLSKHSLNDLFLAIHTYVVQCYQIEVPVVNLGSATCTHTYNIHLQQLSSLLQLDSISTFLAMLFLLFW